MDTYTQVPQRVLPFASSSMGVQNDADVARSERKVLQWMAYLPEDCIRTMIQDDEQGVDRCAGGRQLFESCQHHAREGRSLLKIRGSETAGFTRLPKGALVSVLLNDCSAIADKKPSRI